MLVNFKRRLKMFTTWFNPPMPKQYKLKITVNETGAVVVDCTIDDIMLVRKYEGKDNIFRFKGELATLEISEVK